MSTLFKNLSYRTVLTILFLVQATGIAFACSCMPIETFCETFAIVDSDEYPSVIITAQVGDIEEGAMELKVMQAIYGTVSESTLTIATGNGAMCLAHAGQFKSGDKYLFLLRKFGEGAAEEFHLSSCGVTYLPIKGNKVSGPIAPGKKSMALTEFDPDFCKIINKIKVYPNPADQFLNIEIDTREVISADLKIFDVAGRLIKQRAIEGQKGVKIVHDIQALNRGLYLVQISTGGSQQTFRIVVQ